MARRVSDSATSVAIFNAWAKEELENGSKGPVGISEHPRRADDILRSSSPTPPYPEAKNGFICSQARPCNRAPGFIWGVGFWERSPALNVC